MRDVSRESKARVQMPIHSTKFFKNVVNDKLTEHGKTHKIVHVTEIENPLGTDNLDEYINIASL